MAAETTLTELMSLVSAAVVLIGTACLLGLWGVISVLTTHWKKIWFIICGSVVGVAGLFSFASWIVIIIERNSILDPLDSLSGVVLARDRIIAAGFACWTFLFIIQIALFIILVTLPTIKSFDPTVQIRSSAALSSSALSSSSSAIPMRRATIHQGSLNSLSHFSQQQQSRHSWTSPPTSPTSIPAPLNALPIAHLSTHTIKQETSIPTFPLPPNTIPLRSTDSISSLQISNGPFPFRNSIIQSSSSLPIFPPDQPPPGKKQKRNSGLLKSLTVLRPESPQARKIPSLPALSPRKRFQSVDTIHSVHSDTTVWDDWNAGEEDPKVRERVEMSFESVRMEKSDSPKILSPRLVSSGSRVSSVGERSIVGTPLVGTPHGWMSPASVLKEGF